MKRTIEYKDNTMYVSGEELDPRVIFDCGQAFRFQEKNGRFCGVACGRYLETWKDGERFCAAPVTREEGEKIWEHYFDLGLDYREICKAFEKDPVLKASIREAKGMRLLNQEPFEMVISGIISANNNVPRIQKIVEQLCSAYGDKIAKGIYAFPSSKQLAAAPEQELRALGCGYRAPYIAATAKMVAREEIDLSEVRSMEYEEAKKELTRLPGVGPKVADCILLFSMEKKDAFPKDVWMNRVLKILYHMEPRNEKEATCFVREKFGQYAGIAQQFLFYYARKHKIIG